MAISDIIFIGKTVWKGCGVVLLIALIGLSTLTSLEFREKLNDVLLEKHPFITGLIIILFYGGLGLCMIDAMN